MIAPVTFHFSRQRGTLLATARHHEMPMTIEHEEGGADVYATIAQDLALVARCVRGDTEAWSVLVTAHGGRIYHAIHQTMARSGIRLSREEVEDLHAEALAGLVADDYRRLRTYAGRNECRLGTWVALVAARMTLDHLAELRRWEAGRPGAMDPIPLLTGRPDDGPDAEQILAHRQAVENMESALLRLSPADQLFVKLCFYQEWSGGEIARFLGVSQGTVYSRKHRILERLRALLTGPGPNLPTPTGPYDPHGMGETP
jgi:RNA polymerase sigma factor (sigma-70 family)